jgi:hypothetical protein
MWAIKDRNCGGAILHMKAEMRAEAVNWNLTPGCEVAIAALSDGSQKQKSKNPTTGHSTE